MVNFNIINYGRGGFMKRFQTKLLLILATLVLLVGCVGCGNSNHVEMASGKGDKEHNTEASKTDAGAKASVNLTDNEVKDILNELIPKAVGIYGMFNGTGWFKSDATKTILGEDGYTLVVDENVKSVADLKKVVEDVFTKDIVQKLFYNRYLETKDIGLPLYKDYQGRLYVNIRNGGHGWAEKFLIDTAMIKSQKKNVVEIELDTTVLDNPGDKVTIRIEKVNDKWLMATELVK
jgi:hypothetical protein